jgi:hypothetical protein
VIRFLFIEKGRHHDHPADAITDDWQITDKGVTRWFHTKRGRVDIAELQDYSGAILHREILIGGAELDATAARKLAGALLAAVDELSDPGRTLRP